MHRTYLIHLQEPLLLALQAMEGLAGMWAAVVVVVVVLQEEVVVVVASQVANSSIWACTSIWTPRRSRFQNCGTSILEQLGKTHRGVKLGGLRPKPNTYWP